MKTFPAILAPVLLSSVSSLAEAPVRVTLGTAHHVVFPSEKDEPARVFIEIFTKTTNISDGPVTFWTFCHSPNFMPFVRKRPGSRHWTDLSAGGGGGCGLMYHSITLAPGKSIESNCLMDPSHAGMPFRVVLPVSPSGSERQRVLRIKSNTIMLPTTGEPKKADIQKAVIAAPPVFTFAGKTKGHGSLRKP